MARKFAAKQITLEQLHDEGYYLEEKSLPLGTILTNAFFLGDVLNWKDVSKYNFPQTDVPYQQLIELNTFKPEGYETVKEEILAKLQGEAYKSLSCNYPTLSAALQYNEVYHAYCFKLRPEQMDLSKQPKDNGMPVEVFLNKKQSDEMLALIEQHEKLDMKGYFSIAAERTPMLSELFEAVRLYLCTNKIPDLSAENMEQLEAYKAEPYAWIDRFRIDKNKAFIRKSNGESYLITKEELAQVEEESKVMLKELSAKIAEARAANEHRIGLDSLAPKIFPLIDFLQKRPADQVMENKNMGRIAIMDDNLGNYYTTLGTISEILPNDLDHENKNEVKCVVIYENGEGQHKMLFTLSTDGTLPKISSLDPQKFTAPTTPTEEYEAASRKFIQKHTELKLQAQKAAAKKAAKEKAERKSKRKAMVKSLFS